VSFRLDAGGEALRIYQAGGAVIDSVDFGLQLPGVSQGRYPDGATNLVNFPTTPTPGAANLLDSDLDGMPDVWESAHGLNPLDAHDAALDTDQDGLSNLGEYFSAADPQDPTSSLRLEARRDGSWVVLSFLAPAGRACALFVRELPDTGAGWVKLFEAPPAPVSNRIEFPDTIAGASAGRLYRLSVSVP
jgi:hypothetical protein